ncbi:MAG: hypothetical protein AAB966_03655 [Patescibacteria group bacterium]
MDYYSDELVQELKKFFEEKYSHTFTDEEAREALNNLAGLFLAFARLSKGKKG